MFNCKFPVLGIVPFTGCMKWSYTAVYLPAAELNENNKNLNLTDALNLLKTFSSEETLHGLTCKERFSTVFFPLCELKWEGNGDFFSHKRPCGENEWGYSSWFIPWLLTLWRRAISILISTLSHIKKKYSDINRQIKTSHLIPIIPPPIEREY